MIILLPKLKKFSLLVLIMAALFASSASAARPEVKYETSYDFTALSNIYLAEPELSPARNAKKPQLITQLQDKLQKELDKCKSFSFPPAPEQAQVTLLVVLTRLENGEMSEPAHVDWHRQDSSVTLPTADGKGSTSVDLGVSVPEFVPTREFPFVSLTVCFTLTDNATGTVIYHREEERTDRNTDNPAPVFGKMVRNMCHDLKKLQKKGKL